MGKIFSKRKKSAAAVCIYGNSEHWVTVHSPYNLVLRYLEQRTVTPEYLQTCKEWMKGVGSDITTYSYEERNTESENLDLQFQYVETGGRGVYRALSRIQERDGKAKLCFVFAKLEEGTMEYLYETFSLDYKKYKLKQMLIDDTPEEKLTDEQKEFRKAPALILVDQLGKEGAKTSSEVELALGLNEAKFPYHLQAVDLFNNGEGIKEGLQWLKSTLAASKK